MNKEIKNLIFVGLVLIVSMMIITNVSATTYSFSNSTDVDNISKMVSGDLPMKNGKYIKNGDVIKFKAGNYYGLKLVVKKSITLTSSAKSKGKVLFIGDNKGISINITAKKKVKINGLKIKNYVTGIYGKTSATVLKKLVLYDNVYGIKIFGNKNQISNNKNRLSDFYVSGKNNKVYSNKLNKSAISVKGNKNIVKKNSLKKSIIEVYGKSALVYKNSINNPGFTAINVGGGKNHKISYNKISKSNMGIYIYGKKSVIYKNKISNCNMAIVYEDKSNKIKENVFKKNKKNIDFVEYGPL